MKWFKHISDSLDDPFIFDLMVRFGADGYLVFFGTLEIYSREFKPKDDWKLITTRSYLRRKLNKRQDTVIVKCLKHIQNSGKWDISFNGEQVVIFIPKFIQIIDDWTGRNLRSGSVVAPKNLRVNQNQESRSKKEDKQSEQAPSHFEFKVGDLLDDILKQCETIKKLKRKDGIFNPYMWVQTQVNISGHPQAILDSLKGLINFWDTVKNPWTYANSIIKTKSQNYNEKDFINQQKEFKKEFNINPRIKKLLDPIGDK